VLIGDKVGLRPVEEGDLPLLARWRNDPTNRIRFYTPLLIPASGQKKWYEKLLNDPTRMLFMITRLEDNAPIGIFGLMRIDYRNQNLEPGPFVLDPSQRGQRLAMDALRTLLRYAFGELNMRRVYGTVLDFNISAVLGFESVGFKREGVARKAVMVNGQFHDVIYMGLLREEWLSLNQESLAGE